MKFLTNEIKDRFTLLKRHYHLSTYIAVAIISLVVVSTLTVSSVLYLSLVKSLTSEFEERVKAESREISQVLKNRFRDLEGKLRTLVHDNTVRVTLMLGAENQLAEHLKKVYSSDPAIRYFIRGQTDEYWYSSASSDSSLEAWLALATPPGKPVISNDMSLLGFKLTIVLPIVRQKDQIGSAAAVYFFKNDSSLEKIVQRARTNELVIIDDGNAWNLLTGEISEIPFSYLLKKKKPGRLDYLTTDNGRHVTVVDEALPNVVFVASLEKLHDAKKSVFNNVMIPAAVIIILSLIFSIVLSNRMVRPLKRLSEKAQAIIQGETEFSFSEKESSILEFNRMSDSLEMMVQHLGHLREMERYQELFQGVADIVIIHDMEGHLIDVNEIALRLFGMDQSRLHHMSLLDIIPDKSYPKVMKTLNTLKKEGDQTVLSFSFINHAGEEIFFDCHVKRIIYNGRDVLLNVARDISDRKKTEADLQRSHETLKTVMDSIQATIMACDVADGRILFMNRYMIDIAGDDLVGRKCSENEKTTKHFCVNCGCGSGKQYDHTTALPPWEGQNPLNNRWYLHYNRFIDWVDGRLVRFLVAFDITDVKELALKQEKAEQELKKSQKMQAIGTLAGGVAHDLNNILSGIVSYPDMLLAQLPADSPLKAPLEIIKESGLKASTTVNDLLTLARRGVQIHEVVNINDVVHDYLNSPEHRNLMGNHRNVEICLELEDTIPNILGSPVHLGKAIMNLVKNGVEAIPGKGRVLLRSSMQQVQSPPPGNPKIERGEYVVLTVADNGSGISSENIEKIFEPFFTTKIMGRSGTGLGMAVVWGTVEDHEGYIDLESLPGDGTTFNLYFPVTRIELLRKQVAVASENFSGSGESILVVDDVKEQREIASQMFTHLGYRVFTAASGEEALTYLEDHPVDLVILDMIMEGGIGGLETYMKVLELNPLQKAIITSGYSRSSDVKKALQLGAGQYVKKPFLFDEIARAIWSELHKG